MCQFLTPFCFVYLTKKRQRNLLPLPSPFNTLNLNKHRSQEVYIIAICLGYDVEKQTVFTEGQQMFAIFTNEDSCGLI